MAVYAPPAVLHSTIDDLPVEMLTEIFVHFLDAARPSIRFKHLLALIQVSRAFRNAVIASPILWSVMDGHEPEWVVDTFLQRSGTAPLTLKPDVASEQPMPLANATKIFDHISRVKHLDCAVHRSDLDDVTRLLSEAPTLETFSLTIIHPLLDISSTEWNDVPFLPATLFAGDRPPNLASLCLRGCQIQWASPLLRNLSMLELKVQSSPSYEEFVDVLANMRSLEVLILGPCLPMSAPPDAWNVVTLPNLRDVRLRDDVAFCALFLRYTKCELHHLEIDCWNWRPHLQEDLLQLYSIRLSKFLKIRPLKALKIATCVLFATYGITFGGFETAPTHASAFDHLEDVLYLRIQFPIVQGAMDPILRQIFDTIPFSDVETAELDFAHPQTPLWMSSISPRLPNLENLWVSLPALYGFFVSYRDALADPGLSSTPFSQLAKICSHRSPAELEDDLVEPVLRQRMQEGCPITCFDLSGGEYNPCRPA